MAKGRRQSKENEWSRSARLEPDPCKWLKEQYNDPEISNIDKQKIKTAEKALGCLEILAKNKDKKNDLVFRTHYHWDAKK